MRISDWSSDVCSSDLKGQIFPFVLERLLSVPYVSPNWSDYPAFAVGRVMGRTVSMFHRECDVPACQMLSLMWGTGWPALYEHRNLAEVTHRRGGDLYGGTSLNYHRHVIRMIKSGKTAVKMYPDKPEHAALPDNYLKHAREIDTPVLFMTRSEEHTSELQSLMRISYAVLCLKKKRPQQSPAGAKTQHGKTLFDQCRTCSRLRK